MRTSSITVLMMFILAIFLTLSGCSSTSQDAHKHGAMQMDVQGSETKLQLTCPVMGGKIDKNLYVDTGSIDAEGKRIYVCCEGCLEKLKADPQKYFKQLESQGITLEKAVQE